MGRLRDNRVVGLVGQVHRATSISEAERDPGIREGIDLPRHELIGDYDLDFEFDHIDGADGFGRGFEGLGAA